LRREVEVRYRKLNEEVWVAEGSVVQVRAADIRFLAQQAQVSSKKRARLCAHPGPQDRLHEMFIALDRQTYVRPHRHGGKSESFHVIEGELDVFLFDEDGTVREIVALGDYHSGKPFFYRLMEDVFHTPVIVTPYALFHETTNGPFDRKDTEMASWAPDEQDPFASSAYLEEMRLLARHRAQLSA
jgi:cupin fold WbuC family metalloprotein